MGSIRCNRSLHVIKKSGTGKGPAFLTNNELLHEDEFCGILISAARYSGKIDTV